MKVSERIFCLSILLFFFNNCNEIKKKENIASNKIEDTFSNDYTYRRFDVDSSLSFLVPNNWDSVEHLKFPSYEYKYYIEFKSKMDMDGILVKRLKFKIPTLELVQLSGYYKNIISTTPSNKNIRLLEESYTTNNIPNTGHLFYSILYNEKPAYMAYVYYINSDSSNTVIEIESHNPDTSLSFKKIEHIISSIKITH